MADTLDCVELRKTVWFRSDPTSSGYALAVKHVDGCDACTAFFMRDRAIAHRLSALAAVTVPPTIRSAILRSLPVEPSEEDVIDISAQGARRWPVWWSIAAAAAVVLFALFYPSTQADPLSHLALEAVLRNQVESVAITDHADIDRWLATRLDFATDVPDLPGTSLVGAGLTEFEGQLAATVSYSIDGKPLTYMIVPTSVVFEYSVANGRGPYYVEEGGDKVVIWGNGGSARMLLGSISAHDLLRLAEHCRRHELGIL
ncbi:MAG: hypothetical protein ACE5FJ_04135 [Gemmatimonadales bacterium]